MELGVKVSPRAKPETPVRFMPPHWSQYELPGDHEDPKHEHYHVMRCSPHFRGSSKSRALFCFGFMEGSPAAKAYGCYLKPDSNGKGGFLWVISDPHGRVHHTFRGYAMELPKHFSRLIQF